MKLQFALHLCKTLVTLKISVPDHDNLDHNHDPESGFPDPDPDPDRNRDHEV